MSSDPGFIVPIWLHDLQHKRCAPLGHVGLCIFLTNKFLVGAAPAGKFNFKIRNNAPAPNLGGSIVFPDSYSSHRQP